MKLKFFLLDFYDIRPLYDRSYIKLFCPTCINFSGTYDNHWHCTQHDAGTMTSYPIDGPISSKENNKNITYCSGYKENKDKIKKL